MLFRSASRGTVGDRDGLPSDVLSRMLRWPSVQRVWLPEWLADSAAVLDRLEKEIRREDLTEKEIRREDLTEKETWREDLTEKETWREDLTEKETWREDLTEKETWREDLTAEPERVPEPVTDPVDAEPKSEKSVAGIEGTGSTSYARPIKGTVTNRHQVTTAVRLRGDAGHPGQPRQKVTPVRIVLSSNSGSKAEEFVHWTHHNTGGVEHLDRLDSSRRSRDVVTGVLVSVVETEGPIHSARLAKLVGAEFGLEKVTSQRAGSILRLIDQNTFHIDHESFVWPNNLDPTTWMKYRTTVGQEEPRKINHVSLVEIGNAMADICRQAAGLETDELKKQTARIFGRKVVTELMSHRLEEALSAALRAGKVAWGRDGEVLAGAGAITKASGVTRRAEAAAAEEPVALPAEQGAGTRALPASGITRRVSAPAANESVASLAEHTAEVPELLRLYNEGLSVGQVAARTSLEQREVATRLIMLVFMPEGDITDETGAGRRKKPYTSAELLQMKELYRQRKSLPAIAVAMERTQLGVGWQMLNEGVPRTKP